MSIKMRDDFARSYLPKFTTALQIVVGREASAVRAAFQQRATTPGLTAIYLHQVPEDLKRYLSPYQWGYGKDIVTAAAVEIGQELDPDGPLMRQFTQDYVKVFEARYVEGHLGQLRELPDTDSVMERLDNWVKVEASRRAGNEMVRQGNATFQNAVYTKGFSVRWRIRGPSTCRYCKQLFGKVISQGQSFVDKMGKVDPRVEGMKPMTVYTNVGHPPLHRSCDCFVSI